MLVVIAFIELNPGTRDSFLREFRQIVPLVRADSVVNFLHLESEW